MAMTVLPNEGLDKLKIERLRLCWEDKLYLCITQASLVLRSVCTILDRLAIDVIGREYPSGAGLDSQWPICFLGQCQWKGEVQICGLIVARMKIIS